MVPLLGADATPHGVGGRLCLSLVNSVLWRRSDDPIDQLQTYRDLVRVVAKAGWMGNRSAIERQAASRPAQAKRALKAAVALREDLAVLFAAVAKGETPPADLLDTIGAVGAAGLAQLELNSAGTTRFQLGWARPFLDLPRQQAAVSAVLLLASADLDRVKQCEGPTCGWVFVDTSRNRSRRWCDSRECGNRARVRAHYQRTHSN
jgi:predicted RNA-binding Zn ribbon-like protein